MVKLVSGLGKPLSRLVSLEQPVLAGLLDHADIWRGSQRQAVTKALPTGYQLLDRALHLGGWPLNRLTEILIEAHSIGEMQLLLPAIADQMAQGGWLFLIEPPFAPYAPSWLKAGIKLDRVMVIQSCKQGDELWACEQVMANRSVACCLFWPRRDYLSNKDLKRLQLAAQKGSPLNFIFRSSKMAQQSSPASLRLLVNRATVLNKSLSDLDSQLDNLHHYRTLELGLLKQPAGWSGQKLQLEIALDGKPAKQLAPRSKYPDFNCHTPSTSGRDKQSKYLQVNRK